MNVSVLIPARGRPESLNTSCESVLDLAKNPDKVELLFRFDTDDRYLQANVAMATLCGGANKRILIGERWGYGRMHDYFNQLARASKGWWLMNWNDDMEMLTEGWDELLMDCKELFAVQMPRRDIVTTSDHTVPVYGRPVYEVLGHCSLSSLCDAWLSEVAKAAGIVVTRDDIVFRHFCLPPCERPPADEIAIFRAEEMEALRQADVQRILSQKGGK